jgi:hydrogenase maturation protein HypF
VRALVEDRSDVSTKAARFINGLADGLVQSALAAGHDRIALSGGCLVNRLLARRLQKDLKRAGVTVLGHEKLPPGDGGISAGQAACAAVMVEKGN